MSSDTTPPDPSELTANAPDVGEAGEAAAGGSDGGLSSHPVVEGLLSTKPSEEANTPADLAIRGTKKFVCGALGAKIKSGQTALEDWIRAALGAYRNRQRQQEQPAGPAVQQPAEEPPEETEREEPPEKWGKQEE